MFSFHVRAHADGDKVYIVTDLLRDGARTAWCAFRLRAAA